MWKAAFTGRSAGPSESAGSVVSGGGRRKKSSRAESVTSSAQAPASRSRAGHGEEDGNVSVGGGKRHRSSRSGYGDDDGGRSEGRSSRAGALTESAVKALDRDDDEGWEDEGEKDGRRGERRRKSTRSEKGRGSRSRSRERREKRREGAGYRDGERGGKSSGKARVEEIGGERAIPAMGSFEQFPGQYAGAVVGPMPRQDDVVMSGALPSSDAAHQFPGQNPLTYARPQLGPTRADSYGAAAEYYLDEGQSVNHQPGIRAATPNMLHNPDSHLVAATAEEHFVEDTGHGSAADFYSGKVSPVNEAPIKATSSSSKPTKPPRQSSGSSSRPSKLGRIASTTAAAAATVGAIGLSSAAHHQQAQQKTSSTSSSYQQTTSGSARPNTSTSQVKPSRNNSEPTAMISGEPYYRSRSPPGRPVQRGVDGAQYATSDQPSARPVQGGSNDSYYATPPRAERPKQGGANGSYYGPSQTERPVQGGANGSYYGAPQTDRPAQADANGSYYGPPPQPSRPTEGTSGKQPSRTNSNVPLYAAGAAAAGLAAYEVNQHHQQHANQMNSTSYYGGGSGGGDQGPPRPPIPSGNGSYMNGNGGAGGMAQQLHYHEHKGPMTRLKDGLLNLISAPEDVQKMEEYTEYIGVCKHCFDPRSNPHMAPRQHHYHKPGRRDSYEDLRRRRSNERLYKRGSSESLRRTGSTRVDKESRYYASGSNKSGVGKSELVGAGLAAAGVAAGASALYNHGGRDFDDTYSIKSGHRASSAMRRRSRSSSRERRRRSSHGVVGREEYVTVRTKDGRVERRKVVQRSRSGSRDRKNGVMGAAAGVALGASAMAGGSRSRRESGQDGAWVRPHHSRSRSRSHSPGLGEIFGFTEPKARRSSGRRSPNGSYYDVSRTERRQSGSESGGILGGFFSPSQNERKQRRPSREHRKKQRGFFTFSNGSSSSSDADIAFGEGFSSRTSLPLRKKRSTRSTRKNSNEHLAATVAGIGATAAALAAAQKGHRIGKRTSRPELGARKDVGRYQAYPGHVHGSPGSSNEDEWEDEVPSDADDAASMDSALAFGSRLSHQQSMESVSSGDGLGAWGWRWGGKDKKRRRPSSPEQPIYPPRPDGSFMGPVGAGLAAGAVGGAGLDAAGRPLRPESVATPVLSGPQEPMQYVDPRPLSDAGSRHVSMPGSMPGSFDPPVVRPGPGPIQQPKPIAPNSPAFMQSSSQTDERPQPRRTVSSPTKPGFGLQDAALIGAGALAAGSIIASQGRKSKENVRFGLTEEQQRKDDRERRRERERADEERRRADRTRALKEEAERAAKEEDARQREEAVNRRRQDENRQAAELALARERQEVAEQRAELDRQRKERERREQEEAYHREQSRLAEEARKEQEAAYYREQSRMADEAKRQEESRRQWEAVAAEEAAQNAAKEREERERQLRAQFEAERPAGVERKRREVEEQERQDQAHREYERQEYERRERDREPKKGERSRQSSASTWGPVAAGAAAAATVGAVLAGSEHERHREKDHEREREHDGYPEGQALHHPIQDEKPRESYAAKQITPTEGTSGSPLMDDDIYDRDFFKRKRSDSEHTRQTSDAADRVFEDMDAYYRQPAQSQADFFAPKDILSQPSAGKTRVADPNGDNQVQVYHAADDDIRSHLDRSGYGDEPYGRSRHAPYGVPDLNVIAPTPPQSIAGSVRGKGSVPFSPHEQARDDERDNERQAEPGSAKRDRSRSISWGEDKMYSYDPPSPDSYQERDSYMNAHDAPIGASSTTGAPLDEIVVEAASPGSGTKTTSYREEDLPSSAKYEGASSGIPSFDIDEVEDMEAETPPLYRRLFAESVSDIGLGRYNMDSPGTEGAPPVRGFIEGETDEPTPAEEKSQHVPGGFDDDFYGASTPTQETVKPTGSRDQKSEEPEAGNDRPVVQPEEPAWEPPLSKKDKKKREKAAAKRAGTFDSEPSEPSTPVPVEVELPPSAPAETPQEEPADYFLSKKDKKKRDKASKRGLSDVPTPPAAGLKEVESVDESPVIEEPAWEPPLSKKEQKKREKEAKKQGFGDVAETLVAAGGIAAVAAASANEPEEEWSSSGKKNKKGKKKAREPERDIRDIEPSQMFEPTMTPDTESGMPGGWDATPSESRAATPPEVPDPFQYQIKDEPAPQPEADPWTEFTDTKKSKKNKKKRDSGRFNEPAASSPLRSEWNYDDYMGEAGGTAVANPGSETAPAAETVPYTNGNERATEEVSPPAELGAVAGAMTAEPEDLAGGRSQRDSGYDDDGEGRRGADSSRRTSPEEGRSRSVASEPAVDRDSRRKSKSEKARSEVGYADDPDYYDDRSVAASEPVDVYGGSKPSKHRSRREDDDTASVVSSRSRREKEVSPTAKKEKKGGLFGIFSRKSSESVPLSRQSTRSDEAPLSRTSTRDSRNGEDEDGERKHRKKKHREGSTYGDDDDTRSVTSESRHRHHRDRDERDEDSRERRHSSRHGEDDLDSRSEPGRKHRHRRNEEDDDTMSRASEGGHRHHHRRRTDEEAHNSRDPSFLGMRVEDLPPLPVSPPESPVLAPINLEQDIGTPVSAEPDARTLDPQQEPAFAEVPRDVPKEPNEHRDLPPVEDNDAAHETEREPSVPEPSELQPGHPQVDREDDFEQLPALPGSRPESPTTLAETPLRPAPLARPTSTTAIPLRFPFGHQRERSASFNSPVPSSPSSPVSAQKKPRPSSTEIRPLYLVERNRKVPEVEDTLPSLPSSKPSSRASSIQGSDDWHSAAEDFPSPRAERGLTVDTDHANSYRPDEDYLDSQQTTPKASEFPQTAVLSSERHEPQYYTWDDFERDERLHNAVVDDHDESDLFDSETNDPSGAATSPYVPEPEREQVEDLPALPDSRPASPSLSQRPEHRPGRSAKGIAAAAMFGSAAIMGHKALGRYEDRQKRDREDYEPLSSEKKTSSYPLPAPIEASEPTPVSKTVEEEQPAERPSLSRQVSSKKKKGKKGKKAALEDAAPAQEDDLAAEQNELTTSRFDEAEAARMNPEQESTDQLPISHVQDFHQERKPNSQDVAEPEGMSQPSMNDTARALPDENLEGSGQVNEPIELEQEDGMAVSQPPDMHPISRAGSLPLAGEATSALVAEPALDLPDEESSAFDGVVPKLNRKQSKKAKKKQQKAMAWQEEDDPQLEAQGEDQVSEPGIDAARLSNAVLANDRKEPTEDLTDPHSARADMTADSSTPSDLVRFTRDKDATEATEPFEDQPLAEELLANRGTPQPHSAQEVDTTRGAFDETAGETADKGARELVEDDSAEVSIPFSRKKSKKDKKKAKRQQWEDAPPDVPETLVTPTHEPEVYRSFGEPEAEGGPTVNTTESPARLEADSLPSTPPTEIPLPEAENEALDLAPTQVPAPTSADYGPAHEIDSVNSQPSSAADIQHVTDRDVALKDAADFHGTPTDVPLPEADDDELGLAPIPVDVPTSVVQSPAHESASTTNQPSSPIDVCHTADRAPEVAANAVDTSERVPLPENEADGLSSEPLTEGPGSGRQFPFRESEAEKDPSAVQADERDESMSSLPAPEHIALPEAADHGLESEQLGDHQSSDPHAAHDLTSAGENLASLDRPEGFDTVPRTNTSSSPISSDQTVLPHQDNITDVAIGTARDVNSLDQGKVHDLNPPDIVQTPEAERPESSDEAQQGFQNAASWAQGISSGDGKDAASGEAEEVSWQPTSKKSKKGKKGKSSGLATPASFDGPPTAKDARDPEDAIERHDVDFPQQAFEEAEPVAEEPEAYWTPPSSKKKGKKSKRGVTDEVPQVAQKPWEEDSVTQEPTTVLSMEQATTRLEPDQLAENSESFSNAPTSKKKGKKGKQARQQTIADVEVLTVGPGEDHSSTVESERDRDNAAVYDSEPNATEPFATDMEMTSFAPKAEQHSGSLERMIPSEFEHETVPVDQRTPALGRQDTNEIWDSTPSRKKGKKGKKVKQFTFEEEPAVSTEPPGDIQQEENISTPAMQEPSAFSTDTGHMLSDDQKLFNDLAHSGASLTEGETGLNTKHPAASEMASKQELQEEAPVTRETVGDTQSQEMLSAAEESAQAANTAFGEMATQSAEAVTHPGESFLGEESTARAGTAQSSEAGALDPVEQGMLDVAPMDTAPNENAPMPESTDADEIWDVQPTKKKGKKGKKARFAALDETPVESPEVSAVAATEVPAELDVGESSSVLLPQPVEAETTEDWSSVSTGGKKKKKGKKGSRFAVDEDIPSDGAGTPTLVGEDQAPEPVEEFRAVQEVDAEGEFAEPARGKKKKGKKARNSQVDSDPEPERYPKSGVEVPDAEARETFDEQSLAADSSDGLTMPTKSEFSEAELHGGDEPPAPSESALMPPSEEPRSQYAADNVAAPSNRTSEVPEEMTEDPQPTETILETPVETVAEGWSGFTASSKKKKGKKGKKNALEPDWPTEDTVAQETPLPDEHFDPARESKRETQASSEDERRQELQPDTQADFTAVPYEPLEPSVGAADHVADVNTPIADEGNTEGDWSGFAVTNKKKKGKKGKKSAIEPQPETHESLNDRVHILEPESTPLAPPEVEHERELGDDLQPETTGRSRDEFDWPGHGVAQGDVVVGLDDAMPDDENSGFAPAAKKKKGKKGKRDVFEPEPPIETAASQELPAVDGSNLEEKWTLPLSGKKGKKAKKARPADEVEELEALAPAEDSDVMERHEIPINLAAAQDEHHAVVKPPFAEMVAERTLEDHSRTGIDESFEPGSDELLPPLPESPMLQAENHQLRDVASPIATMHAHEDQPQPASTQGTPFELDDLAPSPPAVDVLPAKFENPVERPAFSPLQSTPQQTANDDFLADDKMQQDEGAWGPEQERDIPLSSAAHEEVLPRAATEAQTYSDGSRNTEHTIADSRNNDQPSASMEAPADPEADDVVPFTTKKGKKEKKKAKKGRAFEVESWEEAPAQEQAPARPAHADEDHVGIVATGLAVGAAALAAAGIAGSENDKEDERPSVSRKPSKKDKRKAKQSSFSTPVEDPSQDSGNELPADLDIDKGLDTTQPDPLIMTAPDNADFTETEQVREGEWPGFSTKPSKKDKKKARKGGMATPIDERTLAAAVPLPEEPDADRSLDETHVDATTMDQVQPDNMGAGDELAIPATGTVFPEMKFPDVDAANQFHDEDRVAVPEEPSAAFAIKPSKKEKRKAKKGNHAAMPEDEMAAASDQQPSVPFEPAETIEDTSNRLGQAAAQEPSPSEAGPGAREEQPTPADEDEWPTFTPKRSKKDKRKAKQSGFSTPVALDEEGSTEPAHEESTVKRAWDLEEQGPQSTTPHRDLHMSSPEATETSHASAPVVPGSSPVDFDTTHDGVPPASFPSQRSKATEHEPREIQDAFEITSDDAGSIPIPEDNVGDFPGTLLDRDAPPLSDRGLDVAIEGDVTSSSHVGRAQHISGPDGNRDVDFAATLAAGLADSGFDPDLVVHDPAFHRRSTPPGTLAEADPEEVFSTTTSKRGKKGKKGKKNQTFDESEPFPEELPGDIQPATGGQPVDDFDTALAKSLQGAGFDPAVLQQAASANTDARSDEVADEPDLSFTTSKRKRKGKKSKGLVFTGDAGDEPAVNDRHMAQEPETWRSQSIEHAEPQLGVDDIPYNDRYVQKPEEYGESTPVSQHHSPERGDFSQTEPTTSVKDRLPEQDPQAYAPTESEPLNDVPPPSDAAADILLAGDRDMDVDEMDKAYSAYKKKEKRKKKKAKAAALDAEAVQQPEPPGADRSMPDTIQGPGAVDTSSGEPMDREGLLEAPGTATSFEPSIVRDVACPPAATSTQEVRSKWDAPPRSVSPTNRVQSLFPGLQRVKRRQPSTTSPTFTAHDGGHAHASSGPEGVWHTSEVSQSWPVVTGRSSPRSEPATYKSNEEAQAEDSPAEKDNTDLSRAHERQSSPSHNIVSRAVIGAAGAAAAAVGYNTVTHANDYENMEANHHQDDVQPWSFAALGAKRISDPNAPEPDGSEHQTVRDSGYQTANSPLLQRHSVESAAQDDVPNIRTAQSRESLRSRRSAEPLHIDTNSGSDWNLTVPKKRETDATPRAAESHSRTPSRETAETPLEPTTKNRASYLFQSPPANLREIQEQVDTTPTLKTEASDYFRETAASATRDLDDDVHPSTDDGRQRSAFSPPPAGPLSPRIPLDAIPEEHHNSKRSKADSDVGGPDAVKALRRTETPQAIRTSRERALSPSVHPAAMIPAPFLRSAKNPLSTDQLINRLSWPAVDEDNETVNINRSLKRKPSTRVVSDHRSPSVMSNRSSISAGQQLRSPEELRSYSRTSNRSSTPTLRRIDRSLSGDLRAASRRSQAGSGSAAGSAVGARASPNTIPFEAPPTPPLNDEDVIDEGAARAAAMSDDVFQGYGDAQGSRASPTRPPSVRKRQSMHISDLESQLHYLAAENAALQDAKQDFERTHEATSYQHNVNDQAMREALDARDLHLQEKDAEIHQIRAILQPLQEEIARLNDINGGLIEANRNLVDDTNGRYATLQQEHANAHDQWQSTSRELDNMREQHGRLNAGMRGAIETQIASALSDKNTEIMRLREELNIATEQIRALQVQIQSSKSSDFLTIRDEDYFDGACQKLCQHVQQWVLRFSKLSDNRICRLSTDLSDEKVEARLDNAILDGSDVDKLLGDRIRRREVFMSVVMTMVWEYVFTRYLFGMDREQRQKLKALEKILAEVGPPRAVAQWRATTLTLLSKRPDFARQCTLDTEAVAHEVFTMLCALLPPPSNAEQQLLTSLQKVIGVAVDVSIEMRTQRAEYIMLPPLQPEYDRNGDLVRKVHFNASLMNERSGLFSSNEELERERAVVKIVLFPLVVKKGDEVGEGEEEIVVCPAQVLVHNEGGRGKKVVRVMSGAMEIDDPRRSRQSLASTAPGSVAF